MLESALVIGGLVGFALLVWWAQKQTKAVDKALENVARLEDAAKTTEKSREVSEVVAGRRDPGLHDRDDIVPNASIPDWLKRH